MATDGNRVSVDARVRGLASGFTILEVLIALVVVTIGASAAIALQASSARSQHQTTQRYEATHLAETILARVQSDASVWRPAPAAPPNALLVNATTLGDDGWFFPPVLDDDDEPDALNSRGIRSPGTGATAADLANRGGRRYCPEYRLRDITGAGPDAPLRAVSVRVYFPRVQDSEALFVDCTDDTRDVLRDLAGLEPGADRVATTAGEFGFGAVGMIQVNGVIRAQRPVEIEEES